MIHKSYLIEENIELLKNNIVLFYGENLGLKNDFRDKIKVNLKIQVYLDTLKMTCLKTVIS